MPPLRPADPIAEHGFAKVMGRTARVSAVIPYYRRRDVLLRCLACLRAQDREECAAHELEVIVVDDGSGDDVEEHLPPDVLYIRQRRNGFGASRARNTGARLANGRYLLFLDPDILVGPGHVGAVLRAFRAFGERAVLAGHVSSYYFEGSPDPRQQFGVWERPDRPTRRFYQLASGNMAISRALFLETPGFDEDLIYGELEDTLLGWHIGQLDGTSIVFSTAMAARHVPHPPGPAHADGARTREILKRKWPAFHDDFFGRSSR
ncbi:glycosyltransferase family 2 protein [Azospirillum sp. sgz302134]